jgi:hypothetical protein
MDKPGHLPGGQISEVMNIHSRKLYMVSTAPEIGQDYWSTAVFPVVDRRFLFGLIRRNVPDFHHQLVSFIRNSMKDAHEVHAQVRGVVEFFPENEWLNNFPSLSPSDGYSKGARKKVRDRLGYEPVAMRSQEAIDKLVGDYGTILEHNREPILSEDLLPASKQEIKQALIAFARDLISRGYASGVDIVRTNCACLATFVPREEAEIVKRFHSLTQSGTEIKDSRDVRNFDEIVKEIADSRAIEIMRRSLNEFDRLLQEFDAATKV